MSPPPTMRHRKACLITAGWPFDSLHMRCMLLQMLPCLQQTEAVDQEQHPHTCRELLEKTWWFSKQKLIGQSNTNMPGKHVIPPLLSCQHGSSHQDCNISSLWWPCRHCCLCRLPSLPEKVGQHPRVCFFIHHVFLLSFPCQIRLGEFAGPPSQSHMLFLCGHVTVTLSLPFFFAGTVVTQSASMLEKRQWHDHDQSN
jgi:hypothetical protein